MGSLRRNHLSTVIVVTCLVLGCCLGCGQGMDGPAWAMARSQLLDGECDADDVGHLELDPWDPLVAALGGKYRKYSGYLQTSDPEVSVDTDVFVPRNPPDANLPLVIVQAAGGGTKNDFAVQRTGRELAAEGFIALSFTARGIRGTGGDPSCSSGTIQFADPGKEIQDVIDVIQWMAGADAPEEVGVSADLARVGIVGASYGGLQALLAGIARQQQLEPAPSFRIKAVVAAATGVNLPRAAGLSPGIPLAYYGWKCILRPGFPDSPALTAWYDILDNRRLSGPVDTLADLELRSVSRGCGERPRYAVPDDLAVLIIHGWADGAFPVDEALCFFDAISRGQPAHKRKLFVGDAAHPSGYYTYATKDQAYNILTNHNDAYGTHVTHEFLKCNLQGAGDTAASCHGDHLRQPITYSPPFWPENNYDLAELPALDSTRYYLSIAGALTPGTPDRGSATTTVTNAWPCNPPAHPLSEALTPAETPLDRVTFTMTSENSEGYYLGGGEAHLFIQSPASELTLGVRVYEVENRRERLITRGVRTFLNPAPGDASRLHEVVIPIDAMAYRFKGGRQLRIKLSNLDRFMDSGSNDLLLSAGDGSLDQCTSVPVGTSLGGHGGECTAASAHISLWTLPSYVDSVQTIHLGGSNPSYVRLPLFRQTQWPGTFVSRP